MAANPVDVSLSGLKEASYVRVESDAPTNAEAILDIERWCREHGFVRTREHWLMVVDRVDGVRVRRAVCYRPAPDEEEQLQRDVAELAARVAAQPLTPSSADLLQE